MKFFNQPASDHSFVLFDCVVTFKDGSTTAIYRWIDLRNGHSSTTRVRAKIKQDLKEKAGIECQSVGVSCWHEVVDCASEEALTDLWTDYTKLTQ